jgi:HSP20 family protein
MKRGLSKRKPTLEWNNWVDRFFNEDFSFPFKEDFRPLANIEDNDKEYVVSLAVPGLKKEDLSVEVKDNRLTVSSEEELSSESEVKNYTRKEYSYKSFLRSFTLPDDAKDSKISAKYENGELILTIPKSKKGEEVTKQIKVD